MATPVIDRLEDALQGLHLAMDALIRRGDVAEAEHILRQLDAVMVNLINDMRTGRP